MPSCALLTQAMLALVQDAARVAASAMVTAGSSELEVEECELNGRRALVLYRNDRPFAALLLVGNFSSDR